MLDELAPVLKSGICVGCGACAVIAPTAITMARNADGAMCASIANHFSAASVPAGICPFNNVAPNEDTHALHLWPQSPHHPSLGRYATSFAGHVVENDYRAAGSSGGLTTWIAAEALATGLVDAVVHVHPRQTKTTEDLFAYSVARSPEAVRAGAKTRYYSVSMDVALAEVMETNARIAVVGVPCYIKAVRNLAAREAKFAEQLRLTLALVCGHMKAATFAESLAWQAGVRPSALKGADFRVKLAGYSANNYGFAAQAASGEVIIRPMALFAGRSWEGGYHRLKACDYCDDVFGETADVTLGDAWLESYVKDSAGTNVIVVRTSEIAQMLEAGQAAGRLKLDPIDASTAAATQAGGLRDRREGLAYRLWIDEKRGRWHPAKRIAPDRGNLSWLRQLNFRLRRLVRTRSFASFRLAKKLGTITPYRLEMIFWHSCFRLLGELEKLLTRRFTL